MKSCCLLYISALAPGVGPEVVAPITRSARRNNLRDGITGLLVFDGENFLQWAEGPAEAIDRLLDRLHRDHRHCDLDILIHAERQQAPLFPDWQLAYHLADPQATDLRRLAELDDLVAEQHFRSMIPELELE